MYVVCMYAYMYECIITVGKLFPSFTFLYVSDMNPSYRVWQFIFISFFYCRTEMHLYLKDFLLRSVHSGFYSASSRCWMVCYLLTLTLIDGDVIVGKVFKVLLWQINIASLLVKGFPYIFLSGTRLLESLHRIQVLLLVVLATFSEMEFRLLSFALPYRLKPN